MQALEKVLGVEGILGSFGKPSGCGDLGCKFWEGF